MGMNALLLAVTLVLHSGDRIAVEGEVREDNGVVMFRQGGLLYSLPAGEVLRLEEDAGRDVNPPTAGNAALKPRPTTRMIVSEEERKRLIAELEKNHSGTPSNTPPPKLADIPPPPAPAPDDEQHWRSQARGYEEGIRRAQEELALLESRAAELQSQINAFFSLGYKPRQFTYQTTQLARTLEQIPYAKLEVTRAERAWQQFREDARKAGVMPGWLR